tara:strand:+ start:1078 stop:1512 length:435 start_codon:yes stop_codon:yes gene_type:complete
MASRKKSTPKRPLEWWEKAIIKAFDVIQGTDSLDKDGRLRKPPKLTDVQLKKLKEEAPKEYEKWQRDPYKFYMNMMNKGGMMKKKKGYSMGGMMPMNEKKINPTTGMAMNKGGMSKKKKGYAKGGMTDMRKTGMFYGGGMARKK